MKYLLLVITSLLLLSCNNKEIKNYEPSTHLNNQETENFKYEIIRYAGKLAGKADHNTKFDEEFDSYYRELAANHQLLYYYEDLNSDEIYFLITRIAPSLKYKKVATGGKLKRNYLGKIIHYQEDFRTWKMEEDELKNKSRTIFNEYVTGKTLSNYYSENSKGEEFIEFPNEHVSFNINQRIWISTIKNPMDTYYKEKPGGEEQ